MHIEKWASYQIFMLNNRDVKILCLWNTEVLFLSSLLYIHNIKIYGLITKYMYIVVFKTRVKQEAMLVP